MKPTGFANQLFQNSREENSHLTGILAVNKEHSPTLFYKTSITLILNPTRKKYKKVKLQTLSIDEIILNKTLRNKVQLKENTLRSYGHAMHVLTHYIYRLIPDAPSTVSLCRIPEPLVFLFLDQTGR